MILTQVKMKFVDDAICKLPTNSGYCSIAINRINATMFEESGKVDHSGEFSILGQIWQGLKKNNGDNWWKVF